MIREKFVLCVLTVISGVVLISAQSSTDSTCFQFTWLGPRYNNESVFLNATCLDATRLASGIPCQQPLVVSEDSSWPDVEYIWRHHASQASCVLTSSDVCAQYTYYFDGHPENSTYMCTRAVDTEGASITNGCFEQRNGSFITKVCFCRSVPGGFPCNAAQSTALIMAPLLLLSLLTCIYNYVLSY